MPTPPPPEGDPPPQKHVRFDTVVRVAMLPQEQRVDAKKARKGLWKPGPQHDELWDGDILDFREQELTAEEFKQLMRKSTNKRSSLPKTLRSFKRLFSVASDKLSAPGKFGGVDVVGARARLSVDLDEDDREETIPDKSEDPIARRDESTTSSGRSNVRVSYIDFDTQAPAAVASSPPRVPKVTRFEPSPPSGPSPSEIKARDPPPPLPPRPLETTKSETTLIDSEDKPPFPKQPTLVRPYHHHMFNTAGVNSVLMSREAAILVCAVLLVMLFIHRFIVRITVFRIIGFLLISTVGVSALVIQSKGKFVAKDA